MIAHISGKLLHKTPNAVIIDVGGVGYELVVPVSTFYDLGEPGAVVALHAYTYVREDALQLFGFRTEQEKRLFLHLISVSGIGPKLAITLLSGMSADELIPAIRKGDLARLTAIPGVGKKTAERLALELKDKLAALAAADSADKTVTSVMSPDALRDDVVSAIMNLGYARPAAEKAIQATLQEMPDVGFKEILRHSLRKLSR
ncbi:MAG: Holliday junction branch migration protein RuvA [Blastocatellia bacterium]